MLSRIVARRWIEVHPLKSNGSKLEDEPPLSPQSFPVIVNRSPAEAIVIAVANHAVAGMPSLNILFVIAILVSRELVPVSSTPIGWYTPGVG